MSTYKSIIFTCLLAFVGNIFGQNADLAPQKQRVLFVLDGSGSMKKEWGSDSKWEIAKQTLSELADSIATNDPDIELGLRIFGHQSPRLDYNCTDSKLEVSFSQEFSTDFYKALNQATPQGHTPIAYSLMQAATDFPNDPSINSIILITDGLENCEGNPCEASAWLQEKRITINPFIIGLDIAPEEVENFNCIGTFINAKDETIFEQVLDQTVKKATTLTTVEINLLSSQGSRITNTPYSLLDAYSGDYLYNFIHAITKEGTPDTLRIDPRGTYDIQVHTNPDVWVSGITLKVGKHNIIDIGIRKGFLRFKHEQLYDEPAPYFVIRGTEDSQFLYAYTFRNEQFVAGTYQLTTTLIPLINEVNAEIPLEETLKETIESNGTLSLEMEGEFRCSIYSVLDGDLRFVYDLGLLKDDFQMKIQPGNYSLLYIPESSKQSETTNKINFTVAPTKTCVVNVL